MTKFEFHKIAYRHDSFGNLRVCFSNRIDRQAIEFDGFNFSKKVACTCVEMMTNLNYLPLERDLSAFIVGIRQGFDIHFIEMENGDLFQIFHICDDEMEPQKIQIFGEKARHVPNPMGGSSYDATRKNYLAAEECILCAI